MIIILSALFYYFCSTDLVFLQQPLIPTRRVIFFIFTALYHLPYSEKSAGLL